MRESRRGACFYLFLNIHYTVEEEEERMKRGDGEGKSIVEEPPGGSRDMGPLQEGRMHA